MNDEILAREYFLVTDHKGHEFHYELQLVPHGGFDYGNRHALVLKRGDGSWDDGFDARYDSRFSTVESFHKYAYEFVRDQVNADFDVEKEEK